MIDSTHHPFALAYQWWLMCDAYFVNAGLSKHLNEKWVREIGGRYLVNRTVPNGQERQFMSIVLGCGQGNEMQIEERAARLSLALSRQSTFKKSPASAASKVSWFVWPQGWTMYDRYAAKAVVGSPAETGTARMELFFAALAMRGWDDILSRTRDVLRDYSFSPLLAERAIDKYLFLQGMSEAECETTVATTDGFVAALPHNLRDEVTRAGEAVGEVLGASGLLHRDTESDRSALANRVEDLRRFKNGIK
jgi:hypothetical protein